MFGASSERAEVRVAGSLFIAGSDCPPYGGSNLSASVLLSPGGEKVLLTHGTAEWKKLLNQKALNRISDTDNPA